MHRVTQHLAIGTIAFLYVHKLDFFPFVLQFARIHAFDIVRGQTLGEKLLHRALPVDQSAITVKGDSFG